VLSQDIAYARGSEFNPRARPECLKLAANGAIRSMRGEKRKGGKKERTKERKGNAHALSATVLTCRITNMHAVVANCLYN